MASVDPVPSSAGDSSSAPSHAAFQQSSKTVSIATVFLSAATAALVSLAWNWQILVGGALLALGVTIKLATNLVGVLVLLGLITVIVSFALALRSDLASKLGVSETVRVAVVDRIVVPTLRRLERVPLWVFIVLVFAAPALGQLNAQFRMLRVLTSVGATTSSLNVVGFSVISFLATLLSSVLGVLSPAWLKPGKIIFGLQTVWLAKSGIGALLSSRSAEASTTASPASLVPLLGTLLIGWGSLVLSTLPEGAALDAARAGLKGAMVAASSVSGVRALMLSQKSSGALSVEKETPSEEVSTQRENLTAALKWIVATGDTAVRQMVEGAAAAPSVFRQLGDSVATPDAPNLVASFVASAEPPLALAVVVSGIRAVPTLLVFVLAELVALVQLATQIRSSSPAQAAQLKNALGLPLVLLPFVASELFSLAKAIGLRRGFRTLMGVWRNSLTDGLSILLWQQPKLLQAWIQLKLADPAGALETASNGTLLRLVLAPRDVLFPTEDAIQVTPMLTKMEVGKLAASVVIDVIGVATFAVPVVGEAFDVVWAPVSGMLIQGLYGAPGFSFIGFAEEILPFTDVLPTATLAWFWLYGTNVPIWAIQGKRLALANQHLLLKKKAA